MMKASKRSLLNELWPDGLLGKMSAFLNQRLEVRILVAWKVFLRGIMPG